MKETLKTAKSGSKDITEGEEWVAPSTERWNETANTGTQVHCTEELTELKSLLVAVCQQPDCDRKYERLQEIADQIRRVRAVLNMKNILAAIKNRKWGDFYTSINVNRE